MASDSPRYLVLADEKLGVFDAKTANGLIRYRPDAVVGVVDSVHAGSTTRQILDSPGYLPHCGIKFHRSLRDLRIIMMSMNINCW